MSIPMRTTVSVFLFAIAAAACGGKAGPAAPGNQGATSAAATIEPLTRSFEATDEDPEATVRAPRVTIPGNPAASDAINRALGTPATADELSSKGEAGLDYTVGYNADGLLSIALTHETLGAYSDSYAEYFLFDTTTGARLTGAELFRPDATDKLAAMVDGKLQAILDATRAERTDCADGDNDPYQGQYTAGHLGKLFLEASGAITFVYDYDFPHVMQACEPDSDVRIPVAELGDYLRADSPLQRARK